jgi:hypothetical protein
VDIALRGDFINRGLLDGARDEDLRVHRKL